MDNRVINDLKQINNYRKLEIQRSCIRPSKNSTIWRYLDLAKYLDLIHNKRLFFVSPIIFKSDDPYEGSFQHKNLEERSCWLGTDVLADKRYDLFDGKYEKLLRKRILKDERRIVVNCWHINDVESAAMWKIYSSFNKGIAIRSSIKNLSKSFKENEDTIFISKINYGEKLKTQDITLWSRFLCKREDFKYENELRIISLVTNPQDLINEGIYIAVDLNMLIDEIIISPDAPEWFFDLIQDMTINKYKIKKKVTKSKLLSIPKY